MSKREKESYHGRIQKKTQDKDHIMPDTGGFTADSADSSSGAGA